ncbi:MAG: glycosyltransferase family 4 protein [Lentisphaerae bacterium]|nr:glycosyltransferase family 4 protein [Lentisphaerota bacterium]
MNIGIFNWRDVEHPQGGGAEAYLHEQGRLWVKQGHRVTWCTASVPGRPGHVCLDGIDIHRAGGRAGIYAAAPLLHRRHLRDADVIIDAENGIPFFTPLFTRQPVVLLIHHIHTQVWRRELPPAMAAIGHFLESRAMPRCYRHRPIVAVSESSRHDVLELMPAATVTVIHNGISADLAPGPKAPRPELVFVGRLKKYKSIEVLLRAVAQVDRTLPLHLVGRGDDEARLRGLAAELGLTQTVFHGFVTDAEKQRLLQQAWVAVNPSFMEGWSITNIEANACGTLVIGSDVPGIRDSIQHARTGLLVPYGDVTAFADAIRGVLADAPRRTAMEQAARAWSQQFTWARAADRFLALLKDVAAQAPG